MADNVPISAGTGTSIATDDAGAGGHVQIIKLAISADGSATIIPADAANGLDVDVTRLPALVASTAAIGKLAANSGVDIGDVDVTSVPADPFGANADAAVAAAAAGSIQAKLRRLTADIDAIKTSVAAATPAGTNNIGDVDVLTLPATPAGTNNIGDVDVLTLPAVEQGRPATGTVVQKASSATNITLQASNANRKGLLIYNDSTAVLYVKFAATASTTSYTVQLGPGAFYELEKPVYTGIVDGIWSAANGNAYVTEVT